jgi:DNA-binding beta-propeller fold protein YncE
LLAALLLAGSLAAGQAELLVALPDYCNTPDGMALLPDNSIILSVPNFNDKASPPVLMKITPDNKAELFYKLPPADETPTGRIGPMGITCAPSGDLYLADMQYMVDKNQKSRLWKIVVKDGKPEKIVLVAKGFNVANGVTIRGDSIYITESVLEEGSKPLVSAVMRFKLTDENVTLKTPLKDDPHVVTTFKSFKEQWLFGADGIAFDSKGNLFVGLFGDGVMHKVEFDAQGAVKANTVFAKAPFLVNCDGMSLDPKTDKLYVADSAQNAIQVISPDGSVKTLWENADAVGKDGKLKGLLDQPCEALLRGNTIVVSNMDWPFPGFKNTKWDMPATLSVIKLE